MNYSNVRREPSRTYLVLLVEDDPAHVRLIREVLKESGVESQIATAGDGVEAMAMLRQQKGYENVPRPDVIVLDLNLPRKNGREVLAEIRSDVNLKRIPVVVLTSSDAEKDIVDVYNLNANSYIVKPWDLDEFIRVVNSIKDFWFTVVKLPPY